MEDPPKRRERLLAMRTAASPGAAGPPVTQAAELPDPLLSSSPAAGTERARFDFYTNPSAAFSGNYGHNKRKNDESVVGASSSSSSSPSFARPNVGPRNYMNPRQSPTHQIQPSFNPHWRSPVQFQPPSQTYRPYPPGAPGPWTTPPTNPNPNFIRGGFTNPNYTPPRDGFSNPNPNYSHPSRGGFSNPNPNFIRGCRPGTSPNPNFYSGSRGRGGGRGLGFNNRFGNPNFYNKSMVEDPWSELEPIVGKLVESINESVKKNESRKFDQGGNSNNNKNNSEKNNSNNNNEKKLSLAEYLDLSFNQAIDET